MRMIKNFSLLFLSVLLTLSCRVPMCKAQLIEKDSDSDRIDPEPRIVDGQASKDIYTANHSDTATLTIDYSYYTTQFSSNVMDSVYKDSVNSLIGSVVSSQTLLESGIYLLQRHFFDAQLDSLAVEWNKYKAEESTPWEMEMSLGIHEYASFAEVTAFGWAYTGGAHGNGYNNYFQFDKSTGRTLKLANFFTDINALNKIAEPHFRKLFELTAEESLNDYGFWFENDQFSVYENFTFNGGAVLFYYNSYDIAPYSGGPTELFVPLEEIKHLLKRNI